MMPREQTPAPLNSCPEAELLKAWVDGELGSAVMQAVQSHVAGCATCNKDIQIMKLLGNALNELGDLADPPASLRKKILARVGGGASARPRSNGRNPFLWIRWASLAGAVTVAAFVGLNSVNFQQVKSGDRVAARPAMEEGPTESAGNISTFSAGGQQQRFAMSNNAPSSPAPVAGAPGFLAPPPVGGGRGWRARQVGGEEQQYRAKEATPSQVSPDDVNVFTRGASVEDVNRKVMRVAVLSVRTRSPLEGIQKDIQQRLKADEGYVELASLSTPEGGERTATMRLRVPVDKLDDYMTWLSSLGEVRSKSVRGEDVTGTWIDQRAEVRELRKEEARLLKVYNSDKNRDRRSEARWQLLRIRPRIAASEERFALTTKLSALSTVELTLVEPAQARIQGNLGADLENTARSAMSAFMVALRVPAAILIWLIVFCPLWLPCLLFYRWATRKSHEWQTARELH